MSKIQMICGDTTPIVFCAKLLEVADEIKHIACVLEYKNGEAYVFNTAMDGSEKAWLRWIFDQGFRPGTGTGYE